MRTHRSRTRPLGKQNFPTFSHANLPVDVLVSRYTLNLLPTTPLNSEFLEMVFNLIGLNAGIQAVSDAFQPFIAQTKIKQIRNEKDNDSLVYRALDTLEDQETLSMEDALRGSLAKSLRNRAPILPEDSDYRKRILRFRALLGLNDEDIAVLECFAIYRVDRKFERYCDSFPSSDWIAMIATALDMTPAAVRGKAARGGTLASKGLISIGNRNLTTDDAVFEYLSGLMEDFLSSNDYSIVEQSTFPMESFPVLEKERHLLVETLRNPAPCHLFFYGRPGTGKTELAKALAAESGRQAFLVKYRDEGDEKDRRGAITATFGMAPSDAVVIIDEADVLLNTATMFARKMVDKGWINNFMDECRHKVIWIANETGSIETSVLRRFSYSLEFKKFTAPQRLSAWKVQLTGHPLCKSIPSEMIGRLAREYEVEAGGIASALKATESILADRQPEAAEIEKTLGSFLEHHEKLSGVRRQKKKLNRLSPNYDVEALNTDLPPTDLIAALRAREKNSTNGRHALPANIMFWGLPGTGKTEFAKYVAQELGKELLVKRMSDLQSMWVGETEKQIAAAFDEAEREGAVLFLDEADSLILDRKTASRSWESSQTNEVLTQMENFNGICICCTNLLDGLDEAALRRFTWKIKFLPLTAEGAESLFRKYFQPSGRLSGEVKTALRAIRDLTPGDFKTVWQQQQYSGGKSLGLDVVNALKQEVSYKRSRSARPIGFGV